MSILRNRLYAILEIASPEDKLSKSFDIFIIIMILLNVTAVILATVHSLYVPYASYFRIFEIFSVAVFTIEYILRILVCPADIKYHHPIFGRIKYILSPLSLVDLIAILPFYLPMLFSFDMRFIRLIRIFRLVRVFKMGRYSISIAKLSSVLKRKKEELVISVTSMILVLLLFSSLMYFFENSAQPEAFSSIPAAMWWGVITLTTVGYGDVYPVTVMGKLFGSVIAFLGIGLFALPAGIIASGFSEEIQRKKSHGVSRCPNCGTKIINQ